MRSSSGIIIALAILAIVEYYGIVTLHVAMRNNGNVFRIAIFSLYILLTLFAWYSIFNFRSWAMEHWNPSLRILVLTSVLGFVAAKVLMAVFMLLDDLRRLVTWIISRIGSFLPQAPREPVEMPNGISRSSFIARMAILAGVVVC